MHPPSASPEGPAQAAAFHGYLDAVRHARITGWAWNREGHHARVVVIVTAGEWVLARVLGHVLSRIEVATMKAEGCRVRAIAEALGISVGSVHGMLKTPAAVE